MQFLKLNSLEKKSALFINKRFNTGAKESYKRISEKLHCSTIQNMFF